MGFSARIWDEACGLQVQGLGFRDEGSGLQAFLGRAGCTENWSVGSMLEQANKTFLKARCNSRVRSRGQALPYCNATFKRRLPKKSPSSLVCPKSGLVLPAEPQSSRCHSRPARAPKWGEGGGWSEPQTLNRKHHPLNIPLFPWGL